MLSRRISRRISVSLDSVHRMLTKREHIIVLDDVFPQLFSAFRIAEFNAYLMRYPNLEVHTTALTYRKELSEFSDGGQEIDEYWKRYPHFKNRVIEFSKHRKTRPSLFYTIMLNNAFNFLPYIEQSQAPFIFTLYPGGSFEFNDDSSDKKLRRVCASPNLKKVITTQPCVREYLLANDFCTPNQIEFVYGLVVQSDQLFEERQPLPHEQQKNTVDICFVAYKYMPQGVDKGYDVFVDTAHLLSTDARIRFHVVGNFDATDIDLGELADRFTFYGPRNTSFFKEFYRKMDIILAPVSPFVLKPGKIDGFPTGCCVEAGLAGVAVFASDPLSQNHVFQNGEELVITDRSPKNIASLVQDYIDTPERLQELRNKGQSAFQRVFSLENQMSQRLELINKYIG